MKCVRPLVKALHPYVPGEQPAIPGLIKLNTNENPYPPSPKVLAALRRAVDGRLRLYPNPRAQALRERLAALHRCGAVNVVVGNGSDELLALATRAFVEPLPGNNAGRLPEATSGQASRSTVQFLTPGYSLYPVLAAIHGAAVHPVALNPDFGLPAVRELRRAGIWDFHAALTFITTPNAPGGRGYPTKDLEAICRAQRGVVVLDEAYVDFAGENALALATRHPHVLVSRTFSKAYSLCFLRIGYMIGDPGLIQALDKIRDSYNVNGLAQVAALATLGDPEYYRRNFRRIIATRERVSRALTVLGFRVFPSATNFILVQPPGQPAGNWFLRLREHRILVRWFEDPATRDFLRITIGTDREMDRMLAATREILDDHLRIERLMMLEG